MSEKMDLFGILNNISNGKDDISEDEEFNKQYNEFMISKFLSMEKSTLFYSYYMTMYGHIPKKAQYLFYFNAIDKKKRFFKYHKKDNENKTINNFDAIKFYFDVSTEKAEEIHDLLNETDIIAIEEIFKGVQNEKRN